MNLTLVKNLAGHLAPASEEDRAEMAKLKLGGIVECQITRKRNPAFHRKMMALFTVAYEAWTETPLTIEYKGQRVMPNMTRFRKDLTVLAGYYEPVYNLRGELRLEATSISFAAMDEDEFERLFSATIQVVLTRILGAQGYTEDSLRKHVERVLAFD